MTIFSSRYNDFMPCDLRETMYTQLRQLECANPGFKLELGLYDEPYRNEMDARKSKRSGRSVLAHIRNAVIKRALKPYHDMVLWLDADVTSYPPDLVARLYAANPGGEYCSSGMISRRPFHSNNCKLESKLTWLFGL